MNGLLVACFSTTGNTAKVGHLISNVAQADYFEIMPVKPYSSADLDWTNANSRTSLEMKESGNYPAIKDKVQDMAQYKMVFLGFPVWWYAVPHIVLGFLESYDFKDKVMLPFVTSGSSGLGKIPTILEAACPEAHWLPGRRFAEHPAQAEVESWVKEHTGWQK